MYAKKSKGKTLRFIVFVIIIVVIVLFIFDKMTRSDNVSSNNSNESNSSSSINNDYSNSDTLVGTFIYKVDGTKYIFNADGTGSMVIGEYNFKFKYHTEENKLEIDYTDEGVHDVKYTYNIKNNELTLVSVEGTVSVGDVYKLERENK